MSSGAHEVEKTVEFILDSQAKAEERFAKADRRMDRLERSIAQTNTIVRGLVRFGVSPRGDVRELQKFRARTDENLAEITDKLNALIDLVNKSLRRNGGAR